MNWVWSLWRKVNKLDQVHERLEDFDEVVIVAVRQPGERPTEYQATGYTNQFDSKDSGVWGTGHSMMDALVALLLEQHKRRNSSGQD